MQFKPVVFFLESFMTCEVHCILDMIRTAINLITGHQIKILFATPLSIKEYDLDTAGVKVVANIRYIYSIDYDNNGFVYCSSVHQNGIQK